MKKSVKRILCGVLSIGMASTLAVEYALRAGTAEELRSQTIESSSGVAFEDVTGAYDTAALSAKNFNASVLESKTPVYETRSVIVTLKGENLIRAADGEDVSSFVGTFTGRKAIADIRREQNAFLKNLSKAGISYRYERGYNTVLNGVAIQVNTKFVSAIKRLPGVESVVISTTYSQPDAIATTSSQEVYNKTSVYGTGIYDSESFTTGEYNYDEGTVIAILDTGLDYTHPAFQTQPSNAKWDKAYVADLLAENQLVAESKSGSLSVNDVYVSAKIPFAYDYADNDADVYPSYSNHGTHVAGIIGGYDENGYTDKDGYIVTEKAADGTQKPVVFRGVAPDAQLVICKVFTDNLDDKDLGGAEATDIIAALDDCVSIGVDVINMSLGTSCGFTTTNDGDDEGELLNKVYEDVRDAGISLVCAASNDYSSGYGGAYGTNLISNPDSGTVGSPSTFPSALSVASISGQESPYMVVKNGDGDSFAFYEEARDANGNPYDFAESMLKRKADGEFEYVVIPGTGSPASYSETIKRLFRDGNGNSLNRIAVVKRGESTFQEKVETAMNMGAVGIIVYNNVAGVIRMNLGELDDPIPAVSVSMDAGNVLVSAAKSGTQGRVGKVVIGKENTAGPFMSEFSSWGPTHDLRLKPEITAHGGEITSTVPGGYGEQSGTSMASPNMAGVMALIRSYIEKTHGAYVDELVQLAKAEDPAAKQVSRNVVINRLANQLIMSTATTVNDQAGRPYSPRKQGAGLGSLDNVINKTSAYLYTDNKESDYRPKIELGDDPEKTGEYTLRFSVKNFGSDALTFSTDQLVFTETIASDNIAVAEQAYALSPAAIEWSEASGGIKDGKITIAGGASAKITVRIELSQKDKDYLERFRNGMYVEGFLKLRSESGKQCDLNVPFLGFYGSWYSSPMLDYTAFEVAADAQDASKTEAEKIQASVWATQPYSTYYNEKYILPMGGYVYLVDDDDDPVYPNEEYCAVSRYNNYYGEDDRSNYLSTTAIKAVYAGLLRNARLVRYKMYNVQTGEEILTGEINRVSKAYSGGGAAVPANVELNISPEEYALLANGQYRIDFDFFPEATGKDDDGNNVFPDEAEEKNTYSFTFTVDYEAPVLEDVRIRYYNYKDGTKEKQRIYLDVDVYDNHYPQAVLLCYPDKDSMLNLVTEYPTPVRNPKRNSTNTVSIEITDIYEKYQGDLYIQVDDYAVNSCLYRLDLNAANANVLPDDYALAAGEDTITLGIYQTHKVKLVYEGNADLSNFQWESTDEKVARVKNGEIVGLANGTATVKVKNRKGKEKSITVRVTDEQTGSLPKYPSIAFGVVTTNRNSIEKASGVVSVNAGQKFKLTIEKEPWYHPMELGSGRVVWESKDPSVATVDEYGNVETLKDGLAIITATIKEDKLYAASVTLDVQDEFRVSNYTLIDYNGVGYNEGDPSMGTDILVIPTDLNIMTIGEEAFKDNDNIRRIVIPASVKEIKEKAFENCTALEEVYFVSTNPREDKDGKVIEYPDGEGGTQVVKWAELSLINRHAFYQCKKLKKLDFSNLKVITVAEEAFAECASLSEVTDMASVGTLHHRAFKGCTSLESVDLTGVFVSGNNVFEGCTGIETIRTGKFTAIGKYMFKDCTGLVSKLTLSARKIGDYAFSGCTKLPAIELASATEEILEADIGSYAFENCGTGLKKGGFTFSFGDEKVRVRTLGENIFKGTKMTSLEINDSFDGSAFDRSGLTYVGVTVTVADGCTQYAEDNGAIFALDGNKTAYTLVFVNASVAGEYTVPEQIGGKDVTRIGAYAFANAKVTKVTLHENIQAIGEGAFYHSALEEISFNGAALKSIPAYAFAGTNLASAILPQTVTAIGDGAFSASKLSAFTANALETVGDGAFYNCTLLTEISLAESVWKLGDYAFAGCIELKKATLPAVTQVGRYTFKDATKLSEVTFGENASTTGSYTFVNTSLSRVTLGGSTTEIGEFAFYGCTSLTEIVFPESVRRIGAFAFFQTEKLTSAGNLNLVEEIGAFAFCNSGLQMLTIDGAKQIGYGAFAAAEKVLRRPLHELDDNDTDEYDNILPIDGYLYYFYLDGEKTAAYNVDQTLALPSAEKIGGYAFMNGGMNSVALSERVREIGEGAFSSAENLATFTLGANNENDDYVVKENVLYRFIGDKSKKEYELVCYPAAKTLAANDQGVKTYAVSEGTLTIAESAFFGLNEGAIDEVTFPYSVNVIGEHAFFESGVKTYVFACIEAPVLETAYRMEIEATIANLAEKIPTLQVYKGYYYSNFETYLLNFTKFGEKTSELEIKYPVNGIGYDNYIWKLYFGKRSTTQVEMNDGTRECLTLLDSMESAETIRTWLLWEATDETKKAEVAAFAAKVQTVRSLYNSATSDGTQSQFVTQAYTEKLLAIEEAIREVKNHFGIKTNIKELNLSPLSTHKSTYLAGEKFDMTGLIVNVVYEDGSVVEADSSKLTLITTQPLGSYDRVVKIAYSDGNSSKQGNIGVTVIKEEEQNPADSDSSGSSSDGEQTSSASDGKKGCKSSVSPLAAVFGLAIITAAICIQKKKEQ